MDTEFVVSGSAFVPAETFREQQEKLLNGFSLSAFSGKC